MGECRSFAAGVKVAGAPIGRLRERYGLSPNGILDDVDEEK